MTKMFRTDIAKQVSAGSSPPTLVSDCISRSQSHVPMRSCTYLSHCVPLEAVLLLGTAAGLVLLELGT
ncbi:hypothetical protein TIFTF001_039711 [Ficus carica]|uniref:Uncharacterized protein n=1 Tax=Ficus carica TaxID=3494 RepID=A0AA87YZ79_FICCA|nr:hypothetical protein TIFTF001_039711 [Ficus carica]